MRTHGVREAGASDDLDSNISSVPFVIHLFRICFSATRFEGLQRPTPHPTGSRTHPWLRAAIPSGFGRENRTRTTELL
jgi:hypothetical protein